MKIGVFDSGFGGLTVLRALVERIPQADYLYLGDTARLPYGAKSRETVARYAASSARFLVGEGAEFLVIACNTASALALDAIRDAVAVPVLGVVETGANAADRSSTTRDVMVIATAATVESHAYTTACAERGMRVIEKACPLLVPLVEEGWIEHPVTADVLRIYLAELMEVARGVGLNADTLVLGCTHYPLLRRQIEAGVPESLRVIDSAEATADEVARRLRLSRHGSNGESRFFATDSVAKFGALGSRFLGRAIGAVELVDLEKQGTGSRTGNREQGVEQGAGNRE
jgi:glutamate racemase